MNDLLYFENWKDYHEVSKEIEVEFASIGVILRSASDEIHPARLSVTIPEGDEHLEKYIRFLIKRQCLSCSMTMQMTILSPKNPQRHQNNIADILTKVLDEELKLRNQSPEGGNQRAGQTIPFQITPQIHYYGSESLWKKIKKAIAKILKRKEK